jgi:urease accessory protein
MYSILSALVLLVCVAPSLLAHPGHGETGFVAGLAHPLTGLDHLAAMIAVGILGVRCGGKGIWIVPLSFLGCMTLGGLLAYAQVPMMLGEWGIALSVLTFGVMVSMATAPSIAVASVVVGAFAVMHGHAHVAEMDGHQSLMEYTLGFLLMTALLHAFGIGFAVLTARRAPTVILRLSGAMITAASVILFIHLL